MLPTSQYLCSTLRPVSNDLSVLHNFLCVDPYADRPSNNIRLKKRNSIDPTFRSLSQCRVLDEFRPERVSGDLAGSTSIPPAAAVRWDLWLR